MIRLPITFAAAIVAAVAGCANAASPGGSPGSGPGLPRVLHGKYQAVAIAFPGRDAGITAISGYPGQSGTLRSWIERTADGGRRWAASRPAIGQHQPGAQAGLAFVSARQGWAYQPGLFFTRDGGATWRAEHTKFPLAGPVAVAGTSTWVAGYSCARGDCPAVIYATDQVGGALHRLAVQPAAAGAVVAMQRPDASVAWLLLARPRGRLRLVTTSDAGRSWTARPLPCRGGGQLSAASAVSLWLICYQSAEGPGFYGVLYRTIDGARTWKRIARENSLDVYAVSSRVAWAVQTTPDEANVVRTVDGGHTWHTVLGRRNSYVQALVPQGPGGAEAIARVFSANGWRFTAYRTRSAGTTWQHAALPP